MISDLQWEESHSLAELFERWPYDCLATDYAMSSHPDICQVPSDDGVRLDNVLSVEDNIL